VAIAIGVGKAEPLPYLSGAINGAAGFAVWAAAMQHEAHVVTDDAEPVTFGRLRRELERALAGPPIHRLLLYFAGHGLIREAGEGLWLLSDWYRELRAVAVEPLKRRLYRYGIDQIAIFADACRKLPADIAAADLIADAVLGRGPRSHAEPWLDKFIATQDGMATFMIPGDHPRDDRCLFSGVLLEGLWGTRHAAFSREKTHLITSRSLAEYLRTEVKQLSGRYGTSVVPSVQPSFPEGDDVYYGDGPRPTAPVFPAWPPGPTEDGFRTLLEAGALESVESSRRGLEAPSGESDRAMAAIDSEDDELFLIDEPDVLFGDADFGGGSAGSGLGRELFRRMRAHPEVDFDSDTGFVVEGLRDAWSVPDIAIARGELRDSWQLLRPDGAFRDAPVPVVLELANGGFAAITCLPMYIAAITLDRGGVSALVYRFILSSGSSMPSEIAIAAMESDHLDPSAALDLAVGMRFLKRVDPVLGVLAAYLYDAIGDRDSIRRTAHFLARSGVAIPYDIALLGQLDCERDGDALIARIPEVEARTPQTELERRHSWVWQRTAAITGPVGGRWPWLRQGWAYLDDPVDDGYALIDPVLLQIRDHLRPARFTTLDAGGAALLRAWLGLQPALDRS
jgi:hypothetical protein